VKVVKNKVAPPFRQAEFEMYYGEGVSREGCLIDVGVEAGIVEKTGSWYIWGEERIGQGRDNARAWLRERPEQAEKLEKTLRDKYFNGAAKAQAQPESRTEGKPEEKPEGKAAGRAAEPAKR